MTTANILSNPQQNLFFPYWNLANLNMVQQMSLLSKMGQSFGVDSQQLFAHNAFGLTPDAINAALQAYQAAAAAATASGQLPVDYNANLNMLGALGSLGLAAAATAQTAEAENSESVLSEQEIEQSVQDIQQSELSQEIKTDEEESSKQDLESVQQQIQQITSASISELANLSAAVDGNDVLNKTSALLTESLYNQQALTAAVTAFNQAQLNQAQLNIKNDELIKEKINNEIKNLQETQLAKTEDIKKIQKESSTDSVESQPKLEEKVEEKKIFPKRRQIDEEENLLEEKLKKELKRVKVDAK